MLEYLNLILIFDPYLPPSQIFANFSPQNRQFQAKMIKHGSPSISEITKPIGLKISHNVKNVK